MIDVPATGSPAEIENLVKTALLEMWAGEPSAAAKARLLTLARTAAQKRQFENWWKFEVAAALWPVAEKIGCDVCVEAPFRTDVALVPESGESSGRSGIQVLIELKTMGTFWKAENINKAFAEPGKKRLLDDLRACASASGVQTPRPFGLVGLLLTHQPERVDSDHGVLDKFWNAALALPKKNGLANLHRFCDSEIELPNPGLGLAPGMARQVFWIRRTSIPQG